MDKVYRRTQILGLLREATIPTQSELIERLARRGIRVTQATVSRDLEELGIIKAREGYCLPDSAEPEPVPQPPFSLVLKEFLREVVQASNLVVLKTHPGNAHTVAVALDAEHWPEVAGTVAGDDTIFVATPRTREATKVRKKLLALLAA